MLMFARSKVRDCIGMKMNVQEAITEASQQFGISLKEKQFEPIYKFCCGNDVFISLPTGSLYTQFCLLCSTGLEVNTKIMITSNIA